MNVHLDKDEISGSEIAKRLEELTLDDTSYDEFKILRRLDQTEPTAETKTNT